MKERLVRGELLVPIVRILKVKRRTGPLPDLGAWETDLRRRAEAGELHGPGAELDAFAARWRELFNFGASAVEHIAADEHGKPAFRVRITGYPDMSACLGHAIAGYVGSLAESAGAAVEEVRLEERPWMHNSVLTLLVCTR
jgi:hypothetical protein